MPGTHGELATLEHALVYGRHICTDAHMHSTQAPPEWTSPCAPLDHQPTDPPTHLLLGEYPPPAPPRTPYSPAPRSALRGRLEAGECARGGVDAAERCGVRLRLLPGEERARSSSMRSRSRLARTYLQARARACFVTSRPMVTEPPGPLLHKLRWWVMAAAAMHREPQVLRLP